MSETVTADVIAFAAAAAHAARRPARALPEGHNARILPLRDAGKPAGGKENAPSATSTPTAPPASR